MTTLTAIDIIVFAGMLLISVCAGIYFAVKGKQGYTTENYYFGGRKVSPIPVAASLSVSFVSAFLMIAYPVEIYLYGSVYAWDALALTIGRFCAAVWFVPIYHRLQLTSIYEMLYLGVVVYLPALSLTATTPLSVHSAIAITSFICTFYTAIGGMKAVIWTDMLQSLLMLAGTVALLVATISSVGGIREVIEAVQRGGRNNFLKFNPDPRIRSSFWTIGVGFTFTRSFTACCSQVYMQRYLSCRSEWNAKLALLLTVPLDIAITLICTAIGLALYAYFEDCDPLLNGEVEKLDQIIPYVALEIFHRIPGMTGLFVTTVFSLTLSTVSSGINSMSAVILHDFLIIYFPQMKQRTKNMASIILSVVFGLLVTILAYIASTTDSDLVVLVYAYGGAITGPLFGLFTMGAFLPWINVKGATCGFICGLVTVVTIAVAAYFDSEIYSPEPNGGKLPVSTDACMNTNSSHLNSTNEEFLSLYHGNASLTESLITNWDNATTTAVNHAEGSYSTTTGSEKNVLSSSLLSLSPYLYVCFGWMISVAIGNIVSLLTRDYDPSKTDWRLFAPGVKSLFYSKGKHKTERHRMRLLSAASDNHTTKLQANSLIRNDNE